MIQIVVLRFVKCYLILKLWLIWVFLFDTLEVLVVSSYEFVVCVVHIVSMVRYCAHRLPR